MINKTDTYKMIKNKLTLLSTVISNCITVYKRGYNNDFDSTDLSVSALLVTMRQDLDEVNTVLVEIIATSKVNPKYKEGDFVHWNNLWSQYNKIKETYEG